METLRCDCGSCRSDKINLRFLIIEMQRDGHIEMVKHSGDTGEIGNCGRKINPIPPRA